MRRFYRLFRIVICVTSSGSTEDRVGGKLLLTLTKFKERGLLRAEGSQRALQLSGSEREKEGADLAQRGVGTAPRLSDCLHEGWVTLAEACIHGKGGQRLEIVHM